MMVDLMIIGSKARITKNIIARHKISGVKMISLLGMSKLVIEDRVVSHLILLNVMIHEKLFSFILYVFTIIFRINKNHIHK